MVRRREAPVWTVKGWRVAGVLLQGTDSRLQAPSWHKVMAVTQMSCKDPPLAWLSGLLRPLSRHGVD